MRSAVERSGALGLQGVGLCWLKCAVRAQVPGYVLESCASLVLMEGVVLDKIAALFAI